MCYLGAPDASLVLPDDTRAEDAAHARDRDAYEGRAQMPYVPFLGDLRAGVVDDDLERLLRLRHAEALVGVHRGGSRGERVGREGEIDEARARDLDALEEVVGIERVDDSLGDVARLLLQRLPEAHRDLRLIVA